MTTDQTVTLDTPVKHTEPAGFSPPMVCEFAGITYRNLDYWLRAGHIDLDDDHEQYRTPGSGAPRRFSLLEAQRFRTLARLIRAGLTLAAAAKLTRQFEANQFLPVCLGDGVWVQVYGR